MGGVPLGDRIIFLVCCIFGARVHPQQQLIAPLTNDTLRASPVEYCNCGGIFLMDKPFLKLGHYSSKAYWRGPLKFSKSGREIIARIQYQMQSETQFFTNRNVIINPSIHFQIFFSVLK